MLHSLGPAVQAAQRIMPPAAQLANLRGLQQPGWLLSSMCMAVTQAEDGTDEDFSTQSPFNGVDTKRARTDAGVQSASTQSQEESQPAESPPAELEVMPFFLSRGCSRNRGYTRTRK